jgi:transcription elongation factor GreA
VAIGSKATVLKKGDSSKRDFDIVGPEEANMLEDKISYTSPLGKALIGTKKGETFTFETPGGSVEYKVLDIK